MTGHCLVVTEGRLPRLLSLGDGDLEMSEERDSWRDLSHVLRRRR